MRTRLDIGEQIDDLAHDRVGYRSLVAQPAVEVGRGDVEEAAQMDLAAESLGGLAQRSSLERAGHTPSFQPLKRSYAAGTRFSGRRPMTYWVSFVLVVTLSMPFGACAQDKPAQDKPDETLSAVVGVSAKIQQNARSAETLGLQRRGTGALIREGYVLTIGYLVIRSEERRVGKECRSRWAPYH